MGWGWNVRGISGDTCTDRLPAEVVMDVMAVVGMRLEWYWDACLPALGINEVDYMESLMIAYESKIIIFEEVLLILSNFRSPFMQLFHNDGITCFSELHKQSFSVIDLYRIAHEL